jgi:hypothetical protein
MVILQDLSIIITLVKIIETFLVIDRACMNIFEILGAL